MRPLMAGGAQKVKKAFKYHMLVVFVSFFVY